MGECQKKNDKIILQRASAFEKHWPQTWSHIFNGCVVYIDIYC